MFAIGEEVSRNEFLVLEEYQTLREALKFTPLEYEGKICLIAVTKAESLYIWNRSLQKWDPVKKTICPYCETEYARSRYRCPKCGRREWC